MRLYLLTMVRKSELQDAVWDEVDFENAVWTIPEGADEKGRTSPIGLSDAYPEAWDRQWRTFLGRERMAAAPPGLATVGGSRASPAALDGVP
jgi:integrase